MTSKQLTAMSVRVALAVAAFTVMSTAALARDAETIISDANAAMGVDTLDSILYYGVATNASLGQNNNAEGPWPRTHLNDYRRVIDFSGPSSRAAAQTYAVPVTGGPAREGSFSQNITPDNESWAQQLEIWTTPWGFLKGAAAASGTTAEPRSIDGKHYNVVTWNTEQQAPSGIPYTVVGYINQDTHLVERVETWVENPVFGDLHVEAHYRDYRDAYGLKYPATMVQKRAGWPTFEAQILAAHANPANLPQSLFPAGAPAAAGGPPGGPPPVPEYQAERLADGVYRITGGYVALAVEFSDHILIFEPAGQNEERAQAVMDTAKRAIPDKPIRYAVLSHHHFDHIGGIAAVVAEGAAIVTHEVNRAFLERALNAPRTLTNDAIVRSGNRPVFETFDDDVRVFEDETRRVEVHLIQGLPHADGLVVAYLPEERLLAYADMFNLPPEDDPVPDPPVVGSMIFADNIERLNLDVEHLITVHPPSPDRPITLSDLRRSLGRE